MKQAVLFDLGNTLFKRLDFSLEAYAKRLDECLPPIVAKLRETGIMNGQPSAEDLSAKIFGQLLELEKSARIELFEFDVTAEITRLLRVHFPAMDDSWEDIIDQIIYARISQEFELKDDAKAMLEDVRAMGMKMILVSNSQFRSANHKTDLLRFGILHLFDLLIFSIDRGLRKPRPEIFRDAIAPWSIQADRAIMVGDMIDADIEGAKTLGMRTILIRTPDNVRQIIAGQHRANAVAGDLSEIPAIIRSF